MCDTFVLIDEASVWFGKNSDRPPQEAQRIERVPAGTPTESATWIDPEAPPSSCDIILSRPTWMWGGEMGVNRHGVAIGNEAVFTRFVERRENRLLGMDLLRLALQQAHTASDAVDVIVEYLERFGQGGAADANNPRFRYDNSYLMADASSAWILETAGRWWAAKRVDRFAAISNDLTLTTDFDRGAAGMQDAARKHGYWRRGEFSFKGAFGRRFMPWAARAQQRRHCSLTGLQNLASAGEQKDTDVAASLMAILRSHHRGERPSSNADVCMHAAGLFRPSETTSSLIAQLTPHDLPRVFATASSLPCLSLFKPVLWNGADFCDAHPDFWNAWREVIGDTGRHARLRHLIGEFEPQVRTAFFRGDTAESCDLVDRWWQSVQSGGRAVSEKSVPAAC